MKTKNQKIGIIGNGFVGGALYEGMRHTNECYVYDVNEEKCISSIEDVAACGFIFICTPTPMSNDGAVEMKYVNSAIESLLEYSIEGSILIVKSTVQPGTCRTLQGKYDIPVISNPEFLTERVAHQDFKYPRCIIIGGDTEYCNELKELYEQSIFSSNNKTNKPFKYYLTDSVTSELIKYTTNCFFSVKISFMNEMKQICSAAGGCWDELVEGFVSEGRVWPEHLNVPGHDGKLGFGGRCFPKDLSAMIKFAKQNDIKPTVLESAYIKNNELRSL